MKKTTFIKLSLPKYNRNRLVLLADSPYEVLKDRVNNRLFVLNQNNELIYVEEEEVQENKIIFGGYNYGERRNF